MHKSVYPPLRKENMRFLWKKLLVEEDQHISLDSPLEGGTRTHLIQHDRKTIMFRKESPFSRFYVVSGFMQTPWTITSPTETYSYVIQNNILQIISILMKFHVVCAVDMNITRKHVPRSFGKMQSWPLLLSLSSSKVVNMPASMKYLEVRERKLRQLATSKCLIYTRASCLHGMVARPWGRSGLDLTALSWSKQLCWHLLHTGKKLTARDTTKSRSMLVVTRKPSVAAVCFLGGYSPHPELDCKAGSYIAAGEGVFDEAGWEKGGLVMKSLPWITPADSTVSIQLSTMISSWTFNTTVLRSDDLKHTDTLVLSCWEKHNRQDCPWHPMSWSSVRVW